jgi:hypothetical protein
MAQREIYLTAYAAELAAQRVIARRVIKGAEPCSHRAMRIEPDKSLSRGFAASVRLMDGAVLPLERLT